MYLNIFVELATVTIHFFRLISSSLLLKYYLVVAFLEMALSSVILAACSQTVYFAYSLAGEITSICRVGLRLFLCYGKLRITGIHKKKSFCVGCEDPWVD